MHHLLQQILSEKITQRSFKFLKIKWKSWWIRKNKIQLGLADFLMELQV